MKDNECVFVQFTRWQHRGKVYRFRLHLVVSAIETTFCPGLFVRWLDCWFVSHEDYWKSYRKNIMIFVKWNG